MKNHIEDKPKAVPEKKNNIFKTLAIGAAVTTISTANTELIGTILNSTKNTNKTEKTINIPKPELSNELKEKINSYLKEKKTEECFILQDCKINIEGIDFNGKIGYKDRYQDIDTSKLIELNSKKIKEIETFSFSVLEELKTNGKIDPEKVKNHKYGNIITKLLNNFVKKYYGTEKAILIGKDAKDIANINQKYLVYIDALINLSEAYYYLNPKNIEFLGYLKTALITYENFEREILEKNGETLENHPHMIANIAQINLRIGNIESLYYDEHIKSKFGSDKYEKNSYINGKKGSLKYFKESLVNYKKLQTLEKDDNLESKEELHLGEYAQSLKSIILLEYKIGKLENNLINKKEDIIKYFSELKELFKNNKNIILGKGENKEDWINEINNIVNKINT